MTQWHVCPGKPLALPPARRTPSLVAPCSCNTTAQPALLIRCGLSSAYPPHAFAQIQLQQTFTPGVTFSTLVRQRPDWDYWLENFNDTAAELLSRVRGSQGQSVTQSLLT